MLANDSQRELFRELFMKGRRLKYKKGELIIRANETPSGVFLIESGLIKVYDITKYGEENLLNIRKPGEMFPLIWSITGEERNIVYEALGDVEVWKLNRETYLDYLKTNKDVLPRFIDIAIEQYRIQSLRILNLEYRTVRERLIAFFLIMAERLGKKTDAGITISAPLRRQDIASSINASRETTGREIAILERNNTIATKQSIITITDIKKLKNYL